MGRFLGGHAGGRRVALAGCAVLAASAAVTTCGRLSRSETLVVEWNAVPITLDPHAHNDNATWALLGNFYDGLVRFSPDLKVEPALARSWAQPSPTRWRFELRDDVTFHDGEPFRAGDVVASFHRARANPEAPIGHQLIGIRGMEADGDHAVVVDTTGPAPTLLNRLVYLFVVRERDAQGQLPGLPNGTGPYRVVEARAGEMLRATAVDGWHGRMDVREVVFHFGPGGPDPAEAILGGRAHIVRALPDGAARRLRGNAAIRLVIQPRLTVRMLSVCPSAATGRAGEALADVRVRRALLLATDRERWIREVYSEAGLVTSQYVHPVVFGYDPALRAVPYDLAEARRLMRDAGFPSGFETDLVHSPAQRDKIAPLVRDLERLGVRTRAVEVPWDQLLERSRSGKSPLTYWGWSCGTGDASDFLDACIHGVDPARGYGSDNFSRFRDLGADALIEAAAVELDRAARLELLQRAQRLALGELPVLPLGIVWDHLGVSPRVEVTPRHDGWLWVAGCRWVR